MKKLILTTTLLLYITSVLSQTQKNFERGDKLLSLSYGIGNSLHGFSDDYADKFNPLTAQFEYALFDNMFGGNGGLGAGAALIVSSSDYRYRLNNNPLEKSTIYDILPAALLNFHYQFHPRIDTYTGFTLGYDLVIKKNDLPQEAPVSKFAFIWKVGGRFYFTENFAFMLEAGYGSALLSAGLTYNIKAY